MRNVFLRIWNSQARRWVPLETMREPEGAQVRLLDEVVRLLGLPRQVHREVIERVEVLERLPLKVVVGHQREAQSAG